MNKTTNQLMIDVLQLQNAFNLYRKRFEEFEKDNTIVDLLNDPKNQKRITNRMTPETFRKYFPRNPEATRMDRHADSQAKLSTFLGIISIVTESKGDVVKCTSQSLTLKGERFDALIPILNAQGEFKIIKSKSFKVFYWSKKFKAVNEGDLILTEDKALLKINYKNDNGRVANVSIEGLLLTTGNTFYVNYLKRNGNESSFTISQIVFQKSEFHDISIGVYATASYISKKPYAGIMVLVDKRAVITAELRSLIDYILYYKRFEISTVSFSSILSNGIEDLPPEVKMWLRVRGELVGKYKGYFANPQLKRFETCLVLINEAGQINISVPAKEFSGIVKIGTSTATEHKLIVHADYIPEFLDYRVLMYIDAIDFFTKKNLVLSGTYNCLRIDDCKPFSAKFVMKQFTENDDKLNKQEIVKFHPVESEEQLNVVKEFLKVEGVYEYFFEEKKNLFGEICLSMDRK